MFKKHVI